MTAQLGVRSRTLTGAILLAMLMALASLVASPPAHAETGGYPHADLACVHAPYNTTGTCQNYDWGTIPGNTSGASVYSSRGYGYRNCTDYVAWKLELLGVSTSLTRGRGDGYEWDDSGTGVNITQTPEVGDAAVWNSGGGGHGHVAFVEAVRPKAGGGYEAQVSEYNQAGTGAYSTGRWVTADNYVDFNGVGTPLGGSSGGSDIVNGGGLAPRPSSSNAYILTSQAGQVYTYNTDYHGGSPSGYTGRFVDAEYLSDGSGYRMVSSSGQVYTFNAPYAGGSPSGYTGEIVAMATKPGSTTAYVLVSSEGQVYTYGGAAYYGGSPQGFSGKVVDIDYTPSGNGYWLLTSQGQVYTYGDAGYAGGSPTGVDGAIVAMAPTASGNGYWLVSSIGQVYTYGDAGYAGGSPGAGEIVDIEAVPGAPGYWLLSKTGGVYTYGGAPYAGGSPQGFSGGF